MSKYAPTPTLRSTVLVTQAGLSPHGLQLEKKVKLLSHFCSTLGHVYNFMNATAENTALCAHPGLMSQAHTAHQTLFNTNDTGQGF